MVDTRCLPGLPPPLRGPAGSTQSLQARGRQRSCKPGSPESRTRPRPGEQVTTEEGGHAPRGAEVTSGCDQGLPTAQITALPSGKRLDCPGLVPCLQTAAAHRTRPCDCHRQLQGQRARGRPHVLPEITVQSHARRAQVLRYGPALHQAVWFSHPGQRVPYQPPRGPQKLYRRRDACFHV